MTENELTQLTADNEAAIQAGKPALIQDVTPKDPPPQVPQAARVEDDFTPELNDLRNGRSGGNTSAVRVYLSALFTIVNGPAVKVEYDAASYDELGEFDLSTHRFTAQSAGKYLIHANVEVNSLFDQAFTYIYKNGSLYSTTRAYDDTGGVDVRAPITDILDLAAGDYIEIWVDPTSAGDRYMEGGSDINWLVIHKLS